MKYTIEQLKDKTDAELNLIAFLAQGWNDHNFDLPNYTPTTNKEQAWDLMVKFNLTIDSEAQEVSWWGEGHTVFSYEDDLLVDVTIASILSAQGE